MNDLISRHAAIDAVRKGYPDVINSEYKDGLRIGTDRAIYHLEKLPPAQPEIIRCKDCKYNATSKKCLNPNSFFLVPADDDFCSYAERREDE